MTVEFTIQPLWYPDDFYDYANSEFLFTWINEVYFLQGGETFHLTDLQADVNPWNGGIDTQSVFDLAQADCDTFVFAQCRGMESSQFKIDDITSMLHHHPENHWWHIKDLPPVYHPLLDNWREIALA